MPCRRIPHKEDGLILGLVLQNAITTANKKMSDYSKELVSGLEEKIISYIKRRGSITNTECRELLQDNLHNTSYFLKKMLKKGLIKREGEHRWTRYRLP